MASLSIYLSNISSTVYTLSTVTEAYSYDLEYNSNNHYNFIIALQNLGTLTPTNISVSSSDGLASFIAAASLFTNKSSSTRRLQSQGIFIQVNGQQILPNIAMNAANSYLNFFFLESNN